MSEFDGLWKHPNNPACTRSVRVIIMFKMNTIRKKKKKKKPLRTVLHICRRNRMSPDSTPETLSRSLLLSPIHTGMGMRLSLKTSTQEIIVDLDHVQFRRITTFPWPTQSTDLPPTSHLLDGFGDVSGDGLTCHKTRTSSVVYPSRNSNQEHEPGGKWKCLAVETSVNLIYLSICLSIY